jgi:hypothetical protein
MVMNVVDLAEEWDKWLALCEHDNETSGFIRCGEFLTGFLSKTLLCGVN